MIGCYNPHKDMIQDCLNSIGNQLNELGIKYEYIIILGLFNSEMCEDAMQVFCSTHSFKCLIKDPTCFTSSSNPSCINLILTNKSRCFQNTSVIETGLSDFHKLTVSVMKASFLKKVPKIINYRNYKYFNNDIFRNELMYEISKIGLNLISCEQFEIIFMTILNKHPPPKKRRYVMSNNSTFMNNTIYKAMMVRSRL